MQNKILLLFLVLNFNISHAQKIKFFEGIESFDYLKGETQINIEYDYSNLMFWDGVKKSGVVLMLEEEAGFKFTPDGPGISEKEYLEKKAANPFGNMGTVFIKNWEDSKQNLFPYKFELLLNKQIKKHGLTASRNLQNVKYTIVLKPVYIHPGYYRAIEKEHSYVSFQYWIVETNNKENVISKLYLYGAMGVEQKVQDELLGIKIQEPFAIAGKRLGKIIVKKGLK